MPESPADEPFYFHFPPTCDLSFESLNGDDNENHRHMIMRIALLDCVLADETVQSLFNQWTKGTGLVAKAEKVRAMGAELAAVCNIETTELFETLLTETETEITFQDFEDVRGKARLFSRALQELSQTLRSIHSYNPLLVELEKYLKFPFEPFVWLYADILFGYLCTIHTIATTVPTGVFFKIQGGPNVPDIATFSALKGETLQDTYLRFAEECRAAAVHQSRKNTRMPKSNGEHLRRYVEWFYRHTIQGKSVNSIANEYHEKQCAARSCSTQHRRDVDRAIKEVEKFLALAQPLNSGRPSSRK